MARTAAHRRQPGPILSAGQRLTLRLAVVMAAIFLANFAYGTSDRNPLADAATAAAGVWWAVTNPWVWSFAVGAVIAVRRVAVLARIPAGAHCA